MAKSDRFIPGGGAGASVGVTALRSMDWDAFAAGLDGPALAALSLAQFTAKAGQVARLPGASGALGRILFGLGDVEIPGAMVFRRLPEGLAPGDYHLEMFPPTMQAGQIALAWELGAYRFDRYRKTATAPPRLTSAKTADPARLEILAGTCRLVRDMINTPAGDMGPLELETLARQVAAAHGARIDVVTGEALLGAGYPAVHAVGRAAHPARAPRMIEIAWGGAGRPLVALIGKGVVFDTGGLDIKPSAGMRWMKKDMGGAAHALGLAKMVMAADLPVRLAVLLPVVENVISGDAMRPGDVLATRRGLSVEVGNTDAEGRLILADALTRAAELAPDLTLDLATLTGAARVALGPQVTPFYTADDDLAAALARASLDVDDPLWRMPLWAGYESALDSDIADLSNDGEPWAQAGSIVAALFLQRFAPPGAWAHFDIFAWNPRGRPGWPKGAETQAIRALFALLERRYG